jgi:hypothetical protein
MTAFGKQAKEPEENCLCREKVNQHIGTAIFVTIMFGERVGPYESLQQDGFDLAAQVAAVRRSAFLIAGFRRRNLRSANRIRLTTDLRINDLGFRVGRTLSARAGAITVAPGEH